MKKVLTILLMICIFAGSSLGQTATRPSGSGTEADPFQVISLDNLYWMSQNTSYWGSSYYYEQTTDINAADTRNWINGFIPIGFSTYYPFKGRYYGKGHTIDSLYMTHTSQYTGLFGVITNAYVDSLGITNLTIHGNNSTGGLAGYVNNSNVKKCYTTGNIYISSRAYSVGGIAGETYEANISSSYSNCNIIATGDLSDVGGLIGLVYVSTINNCYATGDISGVGGVGGLIGRVYTATGTYVNNCYAANRITMTNSYSTYWGGLICDIYTGTISSSNCFWDTEVSGVSVSIAGTGKTTAEMQDYSLFVDSGWDFINETDNGSDDIWGFNQNQNGGYPFLAWQGYTHNPAPILDSISDLELTTAVANLRIHTNVTAYGVCWNTTGNPTINDDHTNEGSISSIGNYTSQLTNLERDKIYYVRAYSINGTDTTYSSALSFKSAHSPEITTLDVNNINESSATGNIHIANLGVPYLTASGVCWNTSGSPTIEDNYADLGAVSDTGYYAVQMSGLTHYSQYYVRAFAINKMDTIYGSETSFTALNADFVASATILEFGDIPIGNLASQKISVSNTGDINLDISEIIMPANYNISPLVVSIEPGGSLEFDLTYFPISSGSFSDTIIFISNAGSDTIYVNGASSYQAAPDAGNAIDFNGSNDYIDLGSPDALDSLAMGNFSIEMWINTSDISTRSILIGNYDGNPSINLELHTDYGGGVLKTYLDGTGFTGTQSVADGKWHHIATVVDFDNDFVKMYIDGINSYSGTGLPEKYAVNRNMMIGRDPRDGSHYYDGQMDELRIWNKALSQEEIRAHYGSIPANREGLVAYYRFDEADGDSVYDQTGNGSSGTLMETTTRIIPSTAPVADPVFDIETNSLSFGSLFSGENNTIPLKVKNAGGGILHIESLGFDTDNFVITPETANLFSGDSIEMQVVFQPETTGDMSGNLVFDHNMGFDTVEMEAYCVDLPHIASFILDGTSANVASLTFAVDDLGSPAPEYGVCWNTTGTPTLDDSYISYGTVPYTGVFNFQVTGLSAATNYIARAYMINGTIITYSDEVSFTTAKVTPVISWAAPSYITYGTALSATQLNATADVPGAFEYSPAAGTMLDAGNNQELSVTFTPENIDTIFVANASVNINVLKASLFVTPENVTRTYGEPNPNFTVAYSGFVNGETSAVIDTEPTASSEADATSDANTYQITATGGVDDNYAFSYQTGTLTVQKAELIATAENTSRVYGDPNPEFIITYSGFVNNETSSVLDNLPVATSDATETSDVNTYDIVVAGGADNNYNYSYINGTLTVTSRSLTLDSFIADNKTYDGTTVVSGAGFNDDRISGDELNFTYDAVFADKNAGASKTVNFSGVEISGGADAGNYTLATTEGTATADITAKALTLSNFTADSKTYDGTTSVTGTGFNDDRIADDELTFTYDAAFEDENAGTGKMVNYINITISSGADAGNYTLASTTGTTVADILTKSLTITADNQVKTVGSEFNFDGAEFTSEGLISGDEITSATLSSDGASSDAVVGEYDIEIGNAIGSGLGNYAITYQEGTLTVTNQIIPEITWNNPSDITYGIALGSEQLNATTITSGTFTYTPSEGMVLSAGQDQVLAVLFIPDDAATYTTNTKSVTINVTKAPLTVTADNITRSYGEDNPELTISYNGFVNGENQTVLDSEPTVSTDATAASNAGTYDILLSGGNDDNYELTLNQGTLTVDKAELTVMAGDANRTYGEANPAFELTYDGFVNGDDASMIDTEPTVSTEATVNSDAGTYDIDPEGGSDNNYDFAYQSGTLTINKAMLAVSVENDSIEQGEAIPEFVLTYSGFVNDEDETVLDETPNATTVATPSSAVGSYDIVVSGGNDNNYDFSYTNGTLVIEPYTSVGDIEFAKVSVYPNPVIDELIIDLWQNKEITKYELVSISGAILVEGQLFSKAINIDMRSIKEGIYILKLFGENTLLDYKIVKR